MVKKYPNRFPEDSLEHQIGVRLMRRMKYFLEGFEKQRKRVPTFNDVFSKSVELAMEVSLFKDKYMKMFDVYIKSRSRGSDITGLFESIDNVVFADVEIRFTLDPTLDVGYISGYEEKDYEIKTPYSWFTLLHEFVHIILREQNYPDDERVAYVIAAGVFYFYKFYNNRRSTLEDFI